MSPKEAGAIDPASAILQLVATAEHVEPDDLTSLAQMHGLADAIAIATRPSAPGDASPVHEQSMLVLGSLEALILGEVENAGAAVSAIGASVAELQKLVESANPDELGGAEATEADAPAAPESAAPPNQDQAEGTIESSEALESRGVAAGPAEETVAGAAKSEQPATGTEGDSCGGADAAARDTDEPPYVSEPLTINDKEREFVKAFVEEAGEHIEAIESAVLEVERDPKNESVINDLFRPFHTIKGMAGFLNLRDINCLTHEAETALDQCRKGQRAVTSGLIDTIFDVVDILKAQTGALAEHLADPQGETVSQPPVAGMIEKLRAVNAGRLEVEGREVEAAAPDQRIGETLVSQGATSEAAIECALEAQKRSGSQKKTGEILIDNHITTPRQVDQALRAQAQARAQSEDAAAQPTARSGPVGDQSVRIETSKLDALVDMVGELVIAQTQVNANSRIDADPKLAKDVGQVTKIVRDVQEVAMAMRMVPIGPTFQKMARLVRDVSRKAGKKVDLKISGEDTELDKNVIQQIGDPLVHMVRNAVDHGVELPDIRQGAGKSETGTVHLAAYHQGGNIVIEISDDGKGLDRDVLVRKAVERGIIEPNAELSDQEAFGLIFAPGFSTAAKVTDISGRGVGMDVVKRNIEQLRGRVEIRSEKGAGSTFSICLPLTLAIIDGMVIGVGTERFIIQTISIEQSLRPTPSQITTVQHRGEVLNNRGRLIPLIQLGQLFGLTDRVDPCEAMVVVCHAENRQIGLVVNELIGQQQVVIKTLGERFEKLKGIAGAAILGDGRVGLILEMVGLAAAHEAMRLPRLKRSDSLARGIELRPVASEDAPATGCGAPDEVDPTSTTRDEAASGADNDVAADPAAEPVLT